jgi:hypothetical protein
MCQSYFHISLIKRMEQSIPWKTNICLASKGTCVLLWNLTFSLSFQTILQLVVILSQIRPVQTLPPSDTFQYACIFLHLSLCLPSDHLPPYFHACVSHNYTRTAAPSITSSLKYLGTASRAGCFTSGEKSLLTQRLAGWFGLHAEPRFEPRLSRLEKKLVIIHQAVQSVHILPFIKLYSLFTSSCSHLLIILSFSSSCVCRSSLPPPTHFHPSVL